MMSAGLRRWHSYIGLFIAPSVLFFALTGAVQIFNLHEAHGGYQPPVWIEKLSAVHKDQVFRKPEDHHDDAAGPAASAAGGAAPAAEDEEDRVSGPTLALKWFCLLVALGLTGSTSIGIWMGITQLRPRSTAWALLLTGALLPLCLLITA
jgi:hypothetical protein